MLRHQFKFHFLSILLFSFIFSGCSWQEYFVVSNESASEITLEYEIENPETGFAIFENKPSVYKLNVSNKIDWNEMLTISDGNRMPHIIQIVVPPKSAIVFGNLSNDHYKKHDQYFINGRVFNLKKMKITTNNKIIEIGAENFDNYFKKKDGNIVFSLK